MTSAAAERKARTAKPGRQRDPEPPEAEAAGGADDGEVLLDLSTSAKRPIIRIDGHAYELAVRNDFGIEDQHALTADGRVFDELFARNDLSDEESGQLAVLLDRMFEKVTIHIPDEICELLGDEQRSDVVMAFTRAPFAKAVAQLLAAQAETEQKTEQDPARSDSTSAS